MAFSHLNSPSLLRQGQHLTGLKVLQGLPPSHQPHHLGGCPFYLTCSPLASVLPTHLHLPFLHGLPICPFPGMPPSRPCSHHPLHHRLLLWETFAELHDSIMPPSVGTHPFCTSWHRNSSGMCNHVTASLVHQTLSLLGAGI